MNSGWQQLLLRKSRLKFKGASHVYLISFLQKQCLSFENNIKTANIRPKLLFRRTARRILVTYIINAAVLFFYESDVIYSILLNLNKKVSSSSSSPAPPKSCEKKTELYHLIFTKLITVWFQSPAALNLGGLLGFFPCSLWCGLSQTGLIVLNVTLIGSKWSPRVTCIFCMPTVY